MMPPKSLAKIYSSSGVSLEENIISCPVKPQASAILNSTLDEQSTPQPSSFKIRKIAGLGVALMAKYSLKPGFQEKALYSFRAVSRIPFSSYR